MFQQRKRGELSPVVSAFPSERPLISHNLKRVRRSALYASALSRAQTASIVSGTSKFPSVPNNAAPSGSNHPIDFVTAGTLKVRDYVMIDGRACRITDVNHAQPGESRLNVCLDLCARLKR